MSLLSGLTRFTSFLGRASSKVQRVAGRVGGGAVTRVAAPVAGGLAAGAAFEGGARLLGGGLRVESSRRRRRRGISARDFRTTQRTMKKIIKMYNKLPKRPSKSSGGYEKHHHHSKHVVG